MVAKVFISSTSRDLSDYRSSAIDICLRMGMLPIAMEHFEAMGKGATEGSKLKVSEADVYVGILAHRYGYIESGYEHAVTEIEYDEAGNRGQERLCLLVDASYPWPPDAIDHAHYEKLSAFRKRIERDVIVQYFTTVDDFRVKLAQSLMAWQKRHPTDAPPAPSIPLPAPAALIPPRPALLVGREKDLERLKKRVLTAGDHVSLTIVQGWPGAGKTTVVNALAHDAEIAAAFPTGVLWIAVGGDAAPRDVLLQLGRLLGHDLQEMKTLAELMQYIQAMLLTKQVLLVVDDVWDADQVIPLVQVVGTACAVLITTRLKSVAQKVARVPSDSYVLGILNDDQSVELMRQLAPSVVDLFLNETYQLARDLEGLPLALRVAGRYLANEASMGFPLLSAFKALRAEALLLDGIAPEDRFDPKTGTTPTIRFLLKQSTDRLTYKERKYFALLGSFVPKPATFTLDAVQAVWRESDPTPFIRTFVDRGLLEFIPVSARYWLHAVLVAHAKALVKRR